MNIKIGIIGLGAIGSVIANILNENKRIDLYYFTRSQKHNIAIRYKERLTSFPITCENLEKPDHHLDWLIICLKANQTKSANDLFHKLIRPKTKVAIVRNGVNISNDISSYTENKLILPCIINCSVQPKEDGSYWQLDHPSIILPKGSLALDFESLFPKDNIKVIQTSDFTTASWKKLIESASLGAVQCIANAPCRIFKEPKYIEMYQGFIKEAILVAQAEGAIIDNNFEVELVSKVHSYPLDKGTSMLTDKLIGNPLELDAKNGAISTLSKLYGIPTPLHDAFCRDNGV